MIGSKFPRHFFNQSQVKTKPIVALACTFSHALCQLRVITSSFDWFTRLSQSFLIGQSNYFGFGFTTIIGKAHYCCCNEWYDNVDPMVTRGYLEKKIPKWSFAGVKPTTFRMLYHCYRRPEVFFFKLLNLATKLSPVTVTETDDLCSHGFHW